MKPILTELRMNLSPRCYTELGVTCEKRDDYFGSIPYAIIIP